MCFSSHNSWFSMYAEQGLRISYSMGEVSDLDHIQRLLQQPVAQELQRQQPASVRDATIRHHTGRQQASRKRQKQEQQQRPAEARRAQAQITPVVDSSWNQPSEHSTVQTWHCAACQLTVSRNQQESHSATEWQLHIQGIRHRRKVLSLEHGQAPGATIVSAFESLPGQPVVDDSAHPE